MAEKQGKLAARGTSVPTDPMPPLADGRDTRFVTAKVRKMFEKALHRLQSGDAAAALEGFNDVLGEDPRCLEARLNRGVALRLLARGEQAVAAFEGVLAKAPDNLSAWINLAALHRDMGARSQAREAFRNIVRLRPDDGDAWVSLAMLEIDEGPSDAAFSAFAEAYRHVGDNARLFNAYGSLLTRTGGLSAANVAFRRAAQTAAGAPGDVDMRAICALNLLNHGRRLGRAQDAAVFADTVLAEPDLPAGLRARLLGARAMVAIELGDTDAASKLADEAFSLDPDAVDAGLARAHSCFAAGEEALAWEALESRLRRPSVIRQMTPMGPMWHGGDGPDAGLSGKTLLLVGEHGFSESIQFIRFVPRLIDLGARVQALVQPALVRLLKRAVPGLDAVAATLDDLPGDHDLMIPIMSLGQRLCVSGAELDPAPFLSPPPPGRIAASIRRAGPQPALRVALALSDGSDATAPESAKLRPDDVALLLSDPRNLYVNVSFNTDPLPASFDGLCEDASPFLRDAEDLAEAIASVDLVIAGDNLIAHLAGAMGRPCWVLVPYPGPWRYAAARTETPWYPSVRLFRQPSSRHWSAVIPELREALAETTVLRREAQARQVQEPVELESVFRTPDGAPRYTMPIPGPARKDPGIAFMIRHETLFGGFEYGLRKAIDVHLQPGDLFLDIGAHWGVYALHAATARADVRVIAAEPAPENLPHVEAWIAANGLGDKVELIPAAIGANDGFGKLLPESTMGRRVADGDHSAAGLKGVNSVTVLSVDSILAERPELAARRIVMKIDVEGFEPDVIEGAQQTIERGRVALIIFEHGRDFDRQIPRQRLMKTVAWLAERGYSFWRFATENRGGVLVPWLLGRELGNVLAFAPDEGPVARYDKPAGMHAPVFQPQRLTPDAATRRWVVEALASIKAADIGYWAHEPLAVAGADSRAAAASAFIEPGRSVLDLGAGLRILEERLPMSNAYRAVDLIDWPARREGGMPTEILDLNRGDFPTGPSDIVVMLGLLAHLHNPEDVLARARQMSERLILTYPTYQLPGVPEERREKGYFNDFTKSQLVRLLARTRWRATRDLPVAGGETLFLCEGAPPEASPEEL